jgi:hypothetical protein
MFCPICGVEGQKRKAYCRTCGVWIDGSGRPARKGAADPNAKLNAMVVFSALSAAFALTSAIVLFATYAGKPEAKWSIYLASAFCIVIAVHQSLNFAFALEMKLRFGRARDVEGDDTSPNDATTRRGLPARHAVALHEPPSVTESTTGLLPNAAPVPVPRRVRTSPLDE